MSVLQQRPIARKPPGVSAPAIVVMAMIVLVCIAATIAALRSSASSGSAKDISSRRERIAMASPGERERLERNLKSFESLSAEEQKRLRDLASGVEREALLGTMDRYHEWLKAQKPSERVALQTSPPQARVERIKTLRQAAANEARWQLADEDRNAVREWLMEVGIVYEEELIEQLARSPFFGGPRAANAEEEREKSVQEFKDFLAKMALNKKRQSLATLAWMQWRFTWFGRGIPDDAIDILRQMVSERAGKQLDEGAYDEIQRLVGWWIGQVEAPGIDRKQLDHFLMNNVPEEERLQLLTLPPHQLYSQLARMEFFDRFQMLPQPGRPGAAGGFSPAGAPRFEGPSPTPSRSGAERLQQPSP